MQSKQIMGKQFFVDDVTRDLSTRYDVKSYDNPMSKFGDINDELALGRFMFLAKQCGEVVGVDFDTYCETFFGEEWCDQPPDLGGEESVLESYLKTAEHCLKAPAVRVETVDGKKIYVPTETLVQYMLGMGPGLQRPHPKLQLLLEEARDANSGN